MINLHSRQRDAHMLEEPRWLIFLRIAQLVFAIVVLGLAGYSVSYWGGISGPSLSIFTSLATMIALAYVFVATFAARSLYNYWAVLGLEIFLLIFWLISFALTASQTATLNSYYGGRYCYYAYCTDSSRGIGAMGGAAGIGALMFVLYGVTTAFVSMSLMRHRKSGGHSIAAPFTSTGTAGPQTAGAPGPKVELQPNATSYPTQDHYGPQHDQQQQYPPQAYMPEPNQHLHPQQQQQQQMANSPTATNMSSPTAPYAPPAHHANPV